MKVGLIGVGRCGLPIALNFEQRGLQVIASSYKQEYIEDLENKIVNTNDPNKARTPVIFEIFKSKPYPRSQNKCLSSFKI